MGVGNGALDSELGRAAGRGALLSGRGLASGPTWLGYYSIGVFFFSKVFVPGQVVGRRFGMGASNQARAEETAWLRIQTAPVHKGRPSGMDRDHRWPTA